MIGVLSDFARTMVTDFPIQTILDRLVERIVDVLPVDGAGVTLIESPGARPHHVAASDESALRYEQLQTELGEGPCLLAFDTGQAVHVGDLAREDRFPRFRPAAVAVGLAAVFTFPLRHGAFPLGALDLYRRSCGPLPARQVTAAQTLADVAAAYLVNAQARVDLQQRSHRFEHASLHDVLTGLPTRALFLERLEHALLRSTRSRGGPVVFFLDIDDFKGINDVHGHRGGDQLLVAVGARLRRLLRPHDTVARLGGDEFVVLCEDITTVRQTRTIAARFETALTAPFHLSDMTVTITASIGFATGESARSSPEALLHAADSAMYDAKRSRRPSPASPGQTAGEDSRATARR